MVADRVRDPERRSRSSLAFEVEGARISIASTANMVIFAAIIGELVAWVKQSDKARGDDLGLVIDGTSELRSETDRTAAAHRLVDTVVALLRVPNVAVYLPEPDGRFALAAATGTVPWEAERPAGGGQHRACARSAVGTELSIPLVGRSGAPRGLVVAAGRRRQDEFMLRLARILGEQAGYQLDDLAQFDALADETRRDPLTGVGNRRFADEVLRELRPGDAVGVVDLDDLRGINARLGHQGGDEVIRAIAQHLVDSVRTADVVARLGGDEFVMVLRDAGDDALALVARIVAEWNDAHPDATFSAGATVHRGGDPEATLRAADAALYAAKRDGSGPGHARPARSSTTPPPASDRPARRTRSPITRRRVPAPGRRAHGRAARARADAARPRAGRAPGPWPRGRRPAAPARRCPTRAHAGAPTPPGAGRARRSAGR